MFNYIFNLIPTAILLGCNSKLFAGKLFSLYSPRIYLYEHSEMQNSGFPAIPSYLDKIEDYIDYITSRTQEQHQMIILDWKKTGMMILRIRLNSEFYRVETRIMAVQPTPKEMVAMIEFFIGFLYKAILDGKPLRPLSSIREERNAVIHSGYNAKTHFDICRNNKISNTCCKKRTIRFRTWIRVYRYLNQG